MNCAAAEAQKEKLLKIMTPRESQWGKKLCLQ